MTNYNERLEEILDNMLSEQVLVNKIGQKPFDEAVAAITSLIKELVAEAKPEEYVSYYATSPVEGGRKIGYDEAAREFEQNLLKALEEV